MDPITQQNNSEIQQLRIGPPMKIRAQLVIGAWTSGEPYVPSAQNPTFDTRILALFILVSLSPSLSPSSIAHIVQLRIGLSDCYMGIVIRGERNTRSIITLFATFCKDYSSPIDYFKVTTIKKK